MKKYIFGINLLYNIFYNLYIKKPLERVALYLKVMTSQNHYTFILHLFVLVFKLENNNILITIFIKLPEVAFYDYCHNLIRTSNFLLYLNYRKFTKVHICENERYEYIF